MIEILGYLIRGAYMPIAAYRHMLVMQACWSTPGV